MPGNVRQHGLQNIRQIAVIAVLLPCRTNMRDSVCHMNNDIAVAAGGMGGGAHQ
ncbi:Uncharacterised protein [Shigella sonnei]|nr:Uncharacterised protein [Shigella sonnei]